VSESCVLGTGVDLVENERMREMLARWDDRFKRRVFHQAECDYCEAKAAPWRHYAGRFAVKEAVAKAFGTGIHPRLNWRDITVSRNRESGAPFVELSAAGRELADRLGAKKVLISLAHTRHYAVAHALVVS
jgi:holo-[acyl-carrier protein] synthase